MRFVWYSNEAGLNNSRMQAERFVIRDRATDRIRDRNDALFPRPATDKIGRILALAPNDRMTDVGLAADESIDSIE